MTVRCLAKAVEEAIADDMEEAAALRAHANSIEDEIANEADNVVQRFFV